MEIRYFAGAADAAGTSSTRLLIPATDAASLIARLGEGNALLADVLARCSILVDGATVRDGNHPVPADARVDVLPPFAGG
jgi:sulfur-carrier protein